MENRTQSVRFFFDALSNPYAADPSCAAFFKTTTLHVPLKIPLTIHKDKNEVVASADLYSSMIPYEGCFTGQIQLEVPTGDGGYFVWQSNTFQLIVLESIDADRAIDSQLQGAYDKLFAYEQAEAQRVKAEAAREENEAGRMATMDELTQSLNHALDMIHRIEDTLDADQLGIGISAAKVDAAGHLRVTLTSGRVIDAGLVIGPKGDKGERGDQVELIVEDGSIKWRYQGENTYRRLIALADLEGADGREVSLQVTKTHIQWRLGGGSWTNLIALEVLKGADGIDGTSFVIKGLYPTLPDLKSAHATGSPGDAYAIGTEDHNTIYLWDGDKKQWADIGSIKGDRGEPGKSFTFTDLTPAQKDELCRFTAAYQAKVDTLSDRVNQDLRTSASPAFASLKAGTITADKVIGAVYA